LIQAHEREGFECSLASFHLAYSGVEEAVGHVVQHALVFGEEELLEDEADSGGPQRSEIPVREIGHVEPGEAHVPVVGRSRVPIKWSKVVLPDPDGPTIATSSPWPTVKLTPRSASTGGGWGRSW